MTKSVLALSTALSILAFSPAFAQETAPAPAATVDCTVAANANDPACVNQQNNATTGQSDSTTTTQPSTTTGQSDSTTATQPSTTTGQSDSTTTTTTTTGQSGTDATTDTTGSTTPAQQSTTNMQTTTGGSLIVPAEQLNGAKLITSSDFVGKTVYDANGQNIGEVNDMVLSDDGQIHAVILGVGGFLGIGEKSVAVSVDAIQLMQDGNAQRLVVNATKEMLESAPSYDVASRRYTESTGTTTTTAPATDMNATGTGTTGTGTTTTTEQPVQQ